MKRVYWLGTIVSLTLMGIAVSANSGDYAMFFSVPVDTQQQQSQVEDTQVMREESIPVEQFRSQLEELQQGMELLVNQAQQLLVRETASGALVSGSRTIGQEMKIVVASMQEQYATIAKVVLRLSLLQKNLDELWSEYDQLGAGQTATKELIAKLTAFLYRMNNELYTNDDIDTIKLLLKSDNIADTLSNDAIVTSLVMKLDELMAHLKEDQAQKLEKAQSMLKLKVVLEQALSKYDATLRNLLQKKAYLVEFIRLYKDKKISLTGSAQDMFETRKDVQDKIQDAANRVLANQSPLGFDYPSLYQQLLLTPEKPYSDHFFSWPVMPINTISTFFGEKDPLITASLPSVGMDVIVEQRTPVYAPADAIVYQIVDRDGIAINRVVLVHKHGYISAFVYLNEIVVHEGDLIKRGQLIGYSGGEPGTRGAGFSAGGSKLHFEMIKDGQWIDPLFNLDLSVIQDRSILPQQYEIKYIRNVAERQDERKNIVFFSGATHEERRLQFLQSYAAGAYRDPGFWLKAAEGTNIDPDLGICIGFAESTLGNFLATDNNIGNVGNNDRGDRVAYVSPYAGARLIYETLNNAYLGGYHTLNEFSGFGNSSGKVYASSKVNRQNNVLHCLSSIKNFLVPEDFPVRIGPNPNLSVSGFVLFTGGK